MALVVVRDSAMLVVPLETFLVLVAMEGYLGTRGVAVIGRKGKIASL